MVQFRFLGYINMVDDPATFLTLFADGTSPYVAVTLLLLFLALSLQVLLPYLTSKLPYAGIPLCPNTHWLYGHLRMTHGRDTFPESYLYVYRDNADQHGRTGYWLGNKPCLGLINLQDARQVLKVEYGRSALPLVHHYVGKVIGRNNLLFLNGKQWKLNRDAVTRTFVHSFLVQSQPDVYQVAQDLIATLTQKMEQENNNSNGNNFIQMDVLPVMKMVTSDVIGKTAFATDFDCCKKLQNSTIVGAFEYMMNDMTDRAESPILPWNYFFSWPTPKNRKLQEQVNILRSFIEQLLQQARQKRNTTNDKKMSSPKSTANFPAVPPTKLSVMDRLVAANEENHQESRSTDQVMIDVVSTLLIAAYDTTSTALAMALYLLATHPDIQDKCVAEVQAVVKESGQLELTDPNPLVYCNALIEETLRLFPPVAVTDRTLSKPLAMEQDGFVLPKGAHCAVPIFAIHRMEEYFSKPLECRPERWCTQQVNGKWVSRDYHQEQEQQHQQPTNSTIPAGNPDALLPFSAGGRNCPGGKFAVQEATLVLANLVQVFRISPVPGYQLKLGLKGFLPFPEGGLPLRLQKR